MFNNKSFSSKTIKHWCKEFNIPDENNLILYFTGRDYKVGYYDPNSQTAKIVEIAKSMGFEVGVHTNSLSIRHDRLYKLINKEDRFYRFDKSYDPDNLPDPGTFREELLRGVIEYYVKEHLRIHKHKAMEKVAKLMYTFSAAMMD